eukprot:799594-Rhodomonas_salina.2
MDASWNPRYSALAAYARATPRPVPPYHVSYLLLRLAGDLQVVPFRAGSDYPSTYAHAPYSAYTHVPEQVRSAVPRYAFCGTQGGWWLHQEKDVFVYRLLSHGTMEEKIYGRQVAIVLRAGDAMRCTVIGYAASCRTAYALCKA